MHAHTKRNELGVQVPTATRVRQVSLGRAGWRCSWGHYQIVVAEVETNALSPSEPAGQGVHVVAAESKPQREGTEHPHGGVFLELAKLRWWVGGKLDNEARYSPCLR
jgi:hypothetical protein